MDWRPCEHHKQIRCATIEVSEEGKREKEHLLCYDCRTMYCVCSYCAHYQDPICTLNSGEQPEMKWDATCSHWSQARLWYRKRMEDGGDFDLAPGE